MIKYILIAVLGSGHGFSHEFATKEACTSAEALVIDAYRDSNGDSSTWAVCVTDDNTNPSYTDSKTDKRTNINPLPQVDFSDVQSESNDLPIHHSDELPIHKD